MTWCRRLPHSVRNDQARQELMARSAPRPIDYKNRSMPPTALWPQRPRRATSSSTRISDRTCSTSCRPTPCSHRSGPAGHIRHWESTPIPGSAPRHQRAVAARAPSLSAASPPSTRATDDHRLQPLRATDVVADLGAAGVPSITADATCSVHPLASGSTALEQPGATGQVGDVVVILTPRSVPATPHYTPQPPPYQLHPNHFWRPSPPNIQSSPRPHGQVHRSAWRHERQAAIVSGGHSHGAVATRR